jgi:spoIIIJ-associated protein
LVRIAVDVEGYRGRRQEALEQHARRAAAKVLETAHPITLDPMSPRDRRIVHVALAGMTGVATSSHGEGMFRRVTISPSGASGRSRS